MCQKTDRAIRRGNSRSPTSPPDPTSLQKDDNAWVMYSLLSVANTRGFTGMSTAQGKLPITIKKCLQVDFSAFML